MNEMKCELCMYYEYQSCKRYPKTLDGRFPYVEFNDWCGEFKIKQEIKCSNCKHHKSDTVPHYNHVTDYYSCALEKGWIKEDTWCESFDKSEY